MRLQCTVGISPSLYSSSSRRGNVLFTAVKVGHSSLHSQPIWELVSSHTWSFCVSLRLHTSAAFLIHSLAIYVNVITRFGMRKRGKSGPERPPSLFFSFSSLCFCEDAFPRVFMSLLLLSVALESSRIFFPHPILYILYYRSLSAYFLILNALPL